MDIPFELLINAIIAGLLLGGFYAAVTAGISISFGMLDIVNIAHPAFILLGSYIAYVINVELGVDPIVVSIIVLPAFYALGAFVYQVYYTSFEKYGQESLRGLAFFFGLLFVTEVALILVFGVFPNLPEHGRYPLQPDRRIDRDSDLRTHRQRAQNADHDRENGLRSPARPDAGPCGAIDP